VDTSTVTNWEGNRTEPDLRLVPEILSFLELDSLPTVESSSPGEVLVAYRRALGVSQSEMARRLGIDPTTLSRWERGNQTKKQTQAARTVILRRG
jgi:DNA-binding transcriptional regulator YiaG